MLYRIYTEDKNQQSVKDIVNKRLDNFTLLIGQGYYKNQSEKALIVEIVGEKLDSTIEKIANDIKRANNQDSVLVQSIPNQSKLI